MLPHALQMDGEPALVVDKRLVALPVQRDPVADVLAELEVVARGAVQLVGEGAKEAIPVAEGRRGVQPQRTQLVCEQLRVLEGVRECLRGAM